MFSKTSPRILRTLGTGLVIVSLGAGFIGGAGVAHGQPIGPSIGGCSSSSSPDGIIPPAGSPDPVHPEGTVLPTSTGRYICAGGRWVSCGDPSLSPSQQAACSPSITGGTRTFGTFAPVRTTSTLTFTR